MRVKVNFGGRRTFPNLGWSVLDASDSTLRFYRALTTSTTATFRLCITVENNSKRNNHNRSTMPAIRTNKNRKPPPEGFDEYARHYSYVKPHTDMM